MQAARVADWDRNPLKGRRLWRVAPLLGQAAQHGPLQDQQSLLEAVHTSDKSCMSHCRDPELVVGLLSVGRSDETFDAEHECGCASRNARNSEPIPVRSRHRLDSNLPDATQFQANSKPHR